MAQGKKSFIAYSDWYGTFKSLPDEVAGKLIKHIFSYVNDENPSSDDYVINALFEQIKSTLKRDLQKWEDQRQQRVEAGKRSAEIRSAKLNERSAVVNETERNSTVNDNVNVNVNVNDNVINNNSFEELKTEINNYQNIYGTEIINEFSNYWFSIDPKKRTKKLRIELQEKFDVKKRLNTWIDKKTNIDIKQISVILLNSETYKSNFQTVYKGLDYKQELTTFYQHRMKQAKLTDSIKEYASHFFNYLKTKQ
jgi:hypothetical protein